MSLEENWLQYFQTLHSNEPPSPDKKFAMRRKDERHGQHSRPLHFSITENEIRIKLEISLKC